MELSSARYIAEKVTHQLGEYCDRIKIVGSIRREQKEVGDIDIVCICKLIPLKDMFDNVVGHQPMKEFIKIVNGWTKIKGEPTGKYTQRMLPEGIKLELTMCRADNFGFLELIRTGSADFSHRMAKRWSKMGYNGENGMLWDSGKPVYLHEEKDLFKILGLEYVEPRDRA